MSVASTAPRISVRLVILLTAAVACALRPHPAGSQARPSASAIGRGLTLDTAVAIALRHSPDMQAARAAFDSASAEVRIARAVPNPTYSAIPSAPYQYAVSMPLDVGPQRTYRGRASTAGADAARGDVRNAARLVVFAVQRAYYDVLLADVRRRLVADRRDVVRQVAASDSARVRVGDAPERNLIRSDVELARADADLARAGVDGANARLALQLLMGVDRPDTALAVSGSLRDAAVAMTPATSLADSLLPFALQRRPDLAAGGARVTQSLALRRLAAASLVPIPQVSYVRQFRAPFESGHYYALGVGIELPFLNRYAGQRERAAAATQAAEYGRRRLVLQAQRDVSSALNDYRTERALVQRYELGLITRVGQNVDAARYAYAHGATSLLDVLDAVRAQQDVLTDYYTARHDYAVSVFALDAAVGATPTTTGGR